MKPISYNELQKAKAHLELGLQIVCKLMQQPGVNGSPASRKGESKEVEKALLQRKVRRQGKINNQ